MPADGLEAHAQATNAGEQVDEPEARRSGLPVSPGHPLPDRLAQRPDREPAGGGLAALVAVGRALRHVEELARLLQGQAGLLAQPAELGGGVTAEGNDSALGHLVPAWHPSFPTPRALFFFCSVAWARGHSVFCAEEKVCPANLTRPAPMSGGRQGKRDWVRAQGPSPEPRPA